MCDIFYFIARYKNHMLFLLSDVTYARKNIPYFAKISERVLALFSL